ncbi:uncharacterized protein SCHCODRAFT_02630811 [Schizophyllum commune H4-8]|uniref:Uncharacterized protein n=1 Tax=Schizophyllum commune (strain H4-8 / FGSC 9210) TaxID=578458 RepID=D8QAA5_SCHCM|nr:uncharacterized protein SCHCODRAFT_02630811 [Schizophyllum commune H4-8]KAI5890083.1 hypothetical protein SCHCODRAFT_02630811 [Schizophyllum commune H4-8]
MFLLSRKTADKGAAPGARGGLFSSLKRAVVSLITPATMEPAVATTPPSRPASRATIDLTPYARPASRATIDLTPYAHAAESATKEQDSDQSDYSSAASSSSSSDTSSAPSSPSGGAADLEADAQDKTIVSAVAPVPVYAPGYNAGDVEDADGEHVGNKEEALANALAAALTDELETSDVPDVYAVPYFRTPSPLTIAIPQARAITPEASVATIDNTPAAAEEAAAAIEPAPAADEGAHATPENNGENASVQADDDVTPSLSPASTCASLSSLDTPASPTPSFSIPEPDLKSLFHSIPNANLPASPIPADALRVDTRLANKIADPAVMFRAAPNRIVASSVCDAYEGLAKTWAPTPRLEGVSYAPGLYADAVWGMGLGERMQFGGAVQKAKQPKVVAGGLYSWGAQGNAWAVTPEDRLWAF